MNHEEIKERLRTFLETETKRAIPSDATDLISAGYLDSFMIIKLITFIEESFKLSVDVENTNEDSFGNLNTLVDQILRWKAKSA